MVIEKHGPRLAAGVNAQTQRYSASAARALVVNSPVYVGGIPQELRGAFGHLSLEQGESPPEKHNDQSALIPSGFMMLGFKIA